ncbi:undecaprenyl diphosphate synthase family protein [Candidatus Woesearchaeota archaeon]|nr:undecaprenyl diphosphate synthase family protein [Candidatus Woesearchaeota archaeon]
MAIRHIAASLDDVSGWCRKNNASNEEGFRRYFSLLGRLPELQARLNIPVLTVNLGSENIEKSDDYLVFCSCIAGFFDELPNKEVIVKHRVKISIFGKWYNMPGKAVESLKKAIEETKEYDGFFLNFCINYDGQDEIVDACRVIAKQVELGKLDPEMITKEAIKENIYSSYFLPPDVVLVYGEERLTGLLLWDSVNSRIKFAGKSFMEFDEGDFEKILMM